MKKIFPLLLLLLLGSQSLFPQTTYYVKPTGDDANPGTSWATAFKTVQKALTTISSGEIWVAAGTYYPDRIGSTNNNDRTASFYLKNNVTIYGGFPATGTPGFAERNWKLYLTRLSGDIDGNGYYSNNSFHVVRSQYANATAILDGFTITKGYANGESENDEGAGIYNHRGSPTIRNCIITANIASAAAGIMDYYSASTISNCIISDNSATYTGGGIDVHASTSRISGCLFSGNSASWGGAISIDVGNPTLTNCTFSNNEASHSGGGLYSNGASDEFGIHPSLASLTNCTFYGNTAAGGGSVFNNQYSSATLTNCILWGSNPVYNGYQSTATITYSIVQGGYNGTGNLGADPLFVNAAGGDFHLQFCSPAIEAGNTAAVTAATDLDGAPRIFYKKVDMGAYESQESRVLYVRANASGLKTGRSWANAFTKLQDALAMGASCASPVEIWVAVGTYYPDETGSTNSNLRTASFELRNHIALYGGFAGTETALDQRSWANNMTTLSGEIQQDDDYSNNAYHVIRSTSVDSTALLDGFIITGGNANTAGDNKGGGLYNVSSSPTVNHCSFEGNRAVEGGALYNHAASPTLTDCHFLWNGANYGGGIYNYSNAPVLRGCRLGGNTAAHDGGGIYNNSVSSATLVNCSFWGNEAEAGGGINNFFSSNVKLVNCTIAANKAGDGGGLFNWVSSPTLTNCILWANTPNGVKGEASITFSIVQGGYSGTGNKAADPQLVDAAGGLLQLRGCSPAVNAATPTGAPTTDAAGATRPALGGYDMGAYELQSDGASSIFYVDQDAPGPLHDGSSWTQAFTSLQAAIDQAATCHSPSQVWVAAGTYYPDATGTNRAASFELHNKVAVYGGFDGTELPTPDLPPVRTNKTVLSGEIQQDNDPLNNSFHVVHSTNNNASALLDGFIITGGRADGSVVVSTGDGVLIVLHDLGGGIFIDNSSPTISNCIIQANGAGNGGGGVAVRNTTQPVLTNCLFYNNGAPRGGGLAAINAYPLLLNCTFSGNTATEGGAIHNAEASTGIMNSIIWGNSGQQIYGTTRVIYSIVQDSLYAGSGDKTVDPKFTNPGTGDLHLQTGSPAIDAGNRNLVENVFRDLDGNLRVQGAQVDMGAYEYPQPPTPAREGLLLSCPRNYTLYSSTGICGAIADFTGIHSARAHSLDTPVTVTYTPDAGSVLPVGDNTITVTATDSKGDTQTCTFTVTVVDAVPPVITCPGPGGSKLLEHTDTEACSYTIRGTTLDVQASDDCAAPLRYFFSLSGATTTGLLEARSLEGVELNIGETTIHYVVRDAAGNEASCDQEVQVIDRTAPTLEHLSVDQPVLYPPNHQMRDITLTYDATDYCGEMATTLSVSSNEPPYGTGSGDTAPDWEIIDNHRVKLRAERSGKGSGRVYTITVTAKDAAGNESHAATTVTVPHDKGAPVTTSKAVSSKEVGSLEVTAVPNPSANGFTLQMQSPSTLPVSIKVIDGAGRIIEQRSGVAPNGVLYLGGTYRPGVYHVQMTQGSVVQTLKLVKQAH